MLVLSLVISACSDGEPSHIQTVEEMYAAYENGDVASFLEPFATEAAISYRLAPTVQDLGMGLHTARASDAATAEAIEHFVAIEPGLTRTCTAISDMVVECDVDYSDAFYGPAGVDMHYVDTVEFNEDGDVSAFVSELPEYQNLIDYHTSFLSWLKADYPEIYDQADIEIFYSLLRPSAYEVLAPYVPMFVEQSIEYPLADTDG